VGRDNEGELDRVFVRDFIVSGGDRRFTISEARHPARRVVFDVEALVRRAGRAFPTTNAVQSSPTT